MAKELIYKDDARRAVLKANPSIAFCIDNIKAVDAVEVVRCKDCKYWEDGVNGCAEHIKLCAMGYYLISGKGYCSLGERREGE